MFKKLLIACVALGSIVVSTNAILVPATSDPWLAGMPDGSLDNVGTPEVADVAPAQSPVLGLLVSGGDVIEWSASGSAGHPGDVSGPDGAASVLTSRFIGANNGISDLISPISALVGVFLGPGQPDLNPAPAALDFSTAASQDYASLSPSLQQAFFMGDGIGTGGSQSIIAPAGATRLFLGMMDGFGWANNAGEYDVSFMLTILCPQDKELPSTSYITVKAFQTFQNPLRRVGAFQLFASDNCDPDPLIYISDSATGFIAGPFHNGDQVEIGKGPTLSNSQHTPPSGSNSAVIHLQGGARMYSVDSSGNTSPITKVL